VRPLARNREPERREKNKKQGKEAFNKVYPPPFVYPCCRPSPLRVRGGARVDRGTGLEIGAGDFHVQGNARHGRTPIPGCTSAKSGGPHQTAGRAEPVVPRRRERRLGRPAWAGAGERRRKVNACSDGGLLAQVLDQPPLGHPTRWAARRPATTTTHLVGPPERLEPLRAAGAALARGRCGRA